MKFFKKIMDSINELENDVEQEINDIKKNISSLIPFKTNVPAPPDRPSLTDGNEIFYDWHISISFGKSTSDNYPKAVALAKMAPKYHEQVDDGQILHQAIYSAKPNEYLSFIKLYELVSSWKSAFAIINGNHIDRKIVGQLNYCYGDKCRSGNPSFCYGASYMTKNPFGCHRLQISACNNPWWSFYRKSGFKWVLDKRAMIEQINSYASIYCLCPAFNYNNIQAQLNKLPLSLSDSQYQRLRSQQYPY